MTSESIHPDLNPHNIQAIVMPHKEPNTPEAQTRDSAERVARIQVKNRRKLYLDRHPSYFTAPDLELADPLLYDRCIRRFQSAAEREADGRAKGYSGVLEADLYRSEAKLAALKGNPGSSSRDEDGSAGCIEEDHGVPYLSYARGQNGEVLPEDPDEVPRSKEEGFERWKFEMTLKFLRGEDEEFDYQNVDAGGEWDDIGDRDVEERWFEDEEPEWLGEEDTGETVGGETGIQDF
ncbi:e7288405-df41-4ee8-9d71-144a7be95104-CDS [Sclerotinia trifoliorum]|uniref:E7288405-df41-4ee8-9d71-144a7be95104-CDS n=1 Tax=Sclerotinia trifoliorum TaxID=28548 RepID=A0A8H2VTM6_9HELO|nr:e7288405-df41-4ee8-9d71-144a7be95104-CDS [Sclerotinia trifoliorum]